MRFPSILCSSLAVVLATACGSTSFVAADFARAEQQYKQMLQATPDLSYPRSIQEDGSTYYIPSLPLQNGRNWTIGFYPGVLWKLYEHSGDPYWKQAARQATSGIEPHKMNGYHHDIGFIMTPSFGLALSLAPEPGDKETLIQAAQTACTRFSPQVGLIQSWNARKSKWADNRWEYPVIIDNMMNLELLFEASRMTGDSLYHRVAVSHADKTMQNHIREDYSIFHVVDYDPETGEVVCRQTSQGYSHESAWSRGQAWGIYGFAMCYRYTHKPEYLATAMGVADFFIQHQSTPADGIPYWDFNIGEFPAPWDYKPHQYQPEPRDASAAAVAASGLLELCQYVPEDKAKIYLAAAEKILRSLSTKEYLAAAGDNNFFLLKHSVGSRPANIEVDTPLIYADYYFLEALLRYKALTSPRSQISVMSFNLRMADDKRKRLDGPNYWDYRKEAVAALIQDLKPDVLGVQEAKKVQTDFLCEALSDYGYVGRPRSDKPEDQQTAIYYRKDKYELADSGFFWASETPEVLSRGWDNEYYRIVTWVKLKAKADGKVSFHFNFHTPYEQEAPIAFREGPKSVMRQIALIAGQAPATLSGDFNMKASSEPMKIYTREFKNSRLESPITDDHLTYNNFGGPSMAKKSIPDHVLYRGFTPLSYRTVIEDYGVPFVSDHYPILSVLQY